MSNDADADFNIARAELFEAMGHPNRIRIIRTLAERPFGFSELKKAVGMGSSGLLSFHLDKLIHLVKADSSGMYALTDEGREALHIIRSTINESGRNNGKHGSFIAYDRRNVVLAAVTIGIIVFGSVAVYQQLEISALSGTVSLQSSERANSTADLAVSNFTVTRLNASARPVMYLVFRNNGTAPASSLGSLLIGVYGQGNSIRFCYNNTQGFSPLFSNESVMIVSPLSCGEIGDSVALTASVNFLTSHGSTTKIVSARTTIAQSQFSVPEMVVINQIGIKTYVMPEIIEGKTIYDWLLMVTNDSPTPIVSVNETALTMHGLSFFHEGCVVTSVGFYGVGKTSPLPSNTTCQINNSIPPVMGPFELGEQLRITVRVEYLDGTMSAATTTAEVVPPYVLYE